MMIGGCIDNQIIKTKKKETNLILFLIGLCIEFGVWKNKFKKQGKQVNQSKPFANTNTHIPTRNNNKKKNHIWQKKNVNVSINPGNSM